MSCQLEDPLKAICLAVLKQCAEDYEKRPDKRPEIREFLSEQNGTYEAMCEYINVHPSKFQAIMRNRDKRRTVARKKIAGRFETNPRSLFGYESTFAPEND